MSHPVLRFISRLWNSWRRRTSLRRGLGPAGERAAEQTLVAAGMRIVERGLRLPPGELDLIALDGETVVFVEVKTRRRGSRGAPALAVDRKKQARMTRAALHYLKSRGLLGRRVRFDVVSIVWPAAAAEPIVEHLRGAFEARDFDGLFS